MSVAGNGALRVPQPHGGVLVMPTKGGPSRNPSGMSKERRELLDAIEAKQVPKVLALLDVLYDRAIGCADPMAANVAAKLWLDQVRGPVKARDDDAIASAVKDQLLALIQEARRRRAEVDIAAGVSRTETSER